MPNHNPLNLTIQHKVVVVVHNRVILFWIPQKFNKDLNLWLPEDQLVVVIVIIIIIISSINIIIIIITIILTIVIIFIITIIAIINTFVAGDEGLVGPGGALPGLISFWQFCQHN